MSADERHAEETPRVADNDDEYGREWTDQERDHLFPDGWPYRDLPLRLSNCPWCGFAMIGLLAENVHPMAFCHNLECRVFTWDPTKSAVDNVRRLDEADQAEAGEVNKTWPGRATDS